MDITIEFKKLVFNAEKSSVLITYCVNNGPEKTSNALVEGMADKALDSSLERLQKILEKSNKL